MKTQSLLSTRRESKRLSIETIEFKNKLILILRNASQIVDYRIKADLAIQTDMPFYKERPTKLKGRRLKKRDVLKEIILFLIQIDDFHFVETLLRKLSVNQNQIIRKIAPRKDSCKKDIWEHVIPVKVIVNEILIMIKNRDISGLDKLLDVYEIAGQRSITKEQDKLLSIYKSTMPNGWDWRKFDVNPMERYHKVGIYI